MVEVVIYGKVIIDDLYRMDGTIARGLLGGGGPQAAFGARLWTDSVGLLTRVGPDLPERHRAELKALDVDLVGMTVVERARTKREPIVGPDGDPVETERAAAARAANWIRMMSTPLDLPISYRRPGLIHLITEYADEPMVEQALALRRAGAILSLEPLIDVGEESNVRQIVALLPFVDIVTPDWPSASRIAGTNRPTDVLRYWADLGPALVAIRNAEHGSYLWARGNRSWHIPAVPVDVHDPTGAGNSYGGGLAVAWLQVGDPVIAGIRAAASASFMLEHVGMPTNPAELARHAEHRQHAILPHVTEL